MIAKNIKGQSFAGCVNYVMKKDAEVLKAEGVMTMSREDICTSFEFQRSVRPEIKSPVGHIHIAFAPEDSGRLTNEFMVKLEEEYMQNMGIKDTQYIIVKHNDTAHLHCHIVYNRINNTGQLITDKNDYRRNVATCKRLKDKYGLTYGKDKSRVNRNKLRGAERTKHQIFDAVKLEISHSKSLDELRQNLTKYGISIELKFCRNNEIVEGISFCKGQHKFKGSQIDRKYSYKGLLKIFAQNHQAEERLNQRIPITLGGVKLTHEQRTKLNDGKAVWLDGMQDNYGKIFNRYVRYSDEKQGLEYFHNNPEAPQMQEQNHNDAAIATNSGLGLFDLSQEEGGNDPEEDTFRRRMQLQQKRKKKRGIKM